MRNLTLSFNPTSSRFFGRLLPLFSLALGLSSVVQAQVATTTQLTLSKATVAAGMPTLLTATVIDAASHSVYPGTVMFYDGTRVLGSAQIVSGTSGAYPQGTANLKTASLAVGANSITAVFAGTTSDLISTSSAKTVTVTGKNKVASTLSGTSTGADFQLTAGLRAFGSGVPTGSVDFVHISSGAVVGSKSLSEAKWKSELSLGSATAFGSVPYELVTGDFNGDGFVDVEATNDQGGALSLVGLLGKGDGTFRSPAILTPGGKYPQIVAAADLNNDGRLDLLVLDNSNTTVSVLLGNGDGTFQPGVSLGSGYAGAAYVGDLNRDGNLDIVATGYFSGSYQIVALLGDGSGGFSTQASYAVNTVAGLAVADLNGDGFLDVLTGSADGVNLWLGKGDGTFLPPSDQHLVSGSTIDTLADVNGDGKLDVVLSNYLKGTVSVSLGNGDGSFELPRTYTFVGYTGPLAVTDFDQDGKPDIGFILIPINDYENLNVLVLSGKGDGTFAPPVVSFPNLAIGFADSSLIAGDFNGDGRPDLVASDQIKSTAITILNGQSTSLQLVKEELGPGTTTFNAVYSGDDAFAGAVSNEVALSQTAIDFSDGFGGDVSGVQLNGGAEVAGGVLQLSSGNTYQATSVFSATPVNIQQFVTDFNFQILDAEADGFTFAIQNIGPTAVGSLGGGLGYRGIGKSLAIKFDIFNNGGEGNNSTGLFTGGANPTIPSTDLTNSGIQLRDGHPFQAHITYDGAYLVMTLTDTVTAATYSQSWAIKIPNIVNGNTAYVGFTGGTGHHTSTETISAWRYSAQTPPPHFPSRFLNTANLIFNGGAIVDTAPLQGSYPATTVQILDVTTGLPNQAGSIYYAAPQNVQAFSTDFSFTILGDAHVADGFTFTLQNEGPQALGGIGGGLGYRDIGKSVAIKFDLYNNDGEGSNSTGLYIDGASPETPAIDLTSSKVNLHDSIYEGLGYRPTFDAHVSYNGTTLTMSIYDRLSNATFSHSWPINIPATVGGPTAYVGFTGGTGGRVSTPAIFNWTYLPGMP